MKISCPTCATSYSLPDEAVGPDGRDVRCNRCGMIWRVDREEPEAIEVAMPEAKVAAAGGGGASAARPAAKAPAAKKEVAADAPEGPMNQADLDALFDGPGDEDASEPMDQAALDALFDEPAAGDASGDDSAEMNQADLDALFDEPVAADGSAEMDQAGLDALFDGPGASDDAGDDENGELDMAALMATIDEASKASDDDPAPDEDLGPTADGAPFAGVSMPAAAKDTDEEPPHDIESLAKPRRRPRLKRSREMGRRASAAMAAKALAFGKFGGIVSFVVVVSVILALIVKREDIVRKVPDLGGLYAAIGFEVNLRGLEFRDIRVSREFDNGATILIVDGAIENVSYGERTVPKIRFGLRGQRGEEIYAWAIDPDKTVIQAGETIPFTSRLTEPPLQTQSMQVRFTDVQIGRTARR
ncbi:putative Zn finger-like uncharacterized protein [Rhodobium orientis]|uniref:Zinc finger/thioredoxin putative domain-containing protein n=1 Tax=Rhodobium orientis TaxID=34017 RepID=A0A327JHR5_9HYPH|nr:zinc-ribbon domain-containing protein [Rhodobium orientis]MBB4303583.1 putative Zn finger-like uncharacterized protein [Rhodobium orientis]MBK5951960.1 hypothetical protein [Rhodobium orientis]RAI24864.1 hypothetical protein CH339_20770 [Rhodobium orientis]